MDIAERVAFLLQIIEYVDEIVLTAAAENRQLMLIKAGFIYMRQMSDGSKIFVCQSEDIDRDDLTFLDQLFQFFRCAKCQVLALINDGDAGTDLFHFVHVVGRIQDRCSALIQFDDPFQNFVAALWIDCYSRLIQNDKLGFMGDPAGDIQTAEQESFFG